MTPRDDRDDDRGDDPEADAQLKQLRAVWVSMRDEEPSDRGLAALMAAARDKASTRKPTESWWQRALAVLRRPPVLALATVAVLLGGALVIAKHGDTLTPPPTGGAAGPAPRATVEPSASPEPPALPAPEPAPVAADPTPPASPAPAASTSAVAPVQPPAHRKHTGTVAKSPLRAGDDQAVLRGRVEATGGLAIATDTDDAPTPMSKSSAAKAATLEESTAATTGSAQDARRSALPPAIDQLVKQCEAAAVRGDCRAVKNLAAQIAKSDPGAYKARIAKNSALARCLE